MRENSEPSVSELRKELDFELLLAQLRQDQLDAALAGRIAESAFFAAEARALREELAQESALCA
jgi:hypothetical protein